MFIEGRLMSVSVSIFQLYTSLFALQRQFDFFSSTFYFGFKGASLEQTNRISD